MAGRGTDIILGGNSDYMARLKLREVLLPRLVKPEESQSHRFRCSAVPPLVSEAAAVAAPPRSSDSLYPCALSDTTDRALGHCGPGFGEGLGRSGPQRD